jgi:hypothetical protein
MPATHWSDLTQYSKIYSNKYWGNFPVRSFISGGINLPDDDIVHNRNLFIDDYMIANRKFTHGCRLTAYKEFQNRLGAWADHIEYYTTAFGDSICICSQGSLHDGAAQEAGFNKLYPLYSQSLSTWIMVLHTV